MRLLNSIILLLGAWLLSADLQADENKAGELKLISGFDISSGNYGESSNTDILYIPFTLKHTAMPWSVKLTLPYLNIRGPGTVVGGIDGVERVDSGDTETTTSSGPGDVILGTSFALDTLWNLAAYVDLTGKIKFPTADKSKGLGTGETDYQIQLDIANAYDKFTPLSTFGFKIPGDTAETDYNNQLLASVGFDYQIKERLNSGILFDYRQASTESSEEKRELLGYINWKLNPHFSVNSYLVTGFGDSSPDIGGGIQLSFKP